MFSASSSVSSFAKARAAAISTTKVATHTMRAARQVAAGIPLEQRIAVPEGRREQEEGNGDGGDPDRPGIGQAGA
ncbi:MAG: hypothetical protein ACI9P3_002562 [Bradyrhizobium sp.]